MTHNNQHTKANANNSSKSGHTLTDAERSKGGRNSHSASEHASKSAHSKADNSTHSTTGGSGSHAAKH